MKNPNREGICMLRVFRGGTARGFVKDDVRIYLLHVDGLLG